MGVATLDLAESVANLIQRIDGGDGDLELAPVDESGQLGQDLRVRSGDVLPAILVPCLCAAAKSMIVSIRSGGTPSSIASST